MLKVVYGAWYATRQVRPMGWREVLVLAQRPPFEVARAAARMRYWPGCVMPRLLLWVFLQVAGADWRQAAVNDLSDMRAVCVCPC